MSIVALVFGIAILFTLAGLLGNRATRPMGIALLLLLILAGLYVTAFTVRVEHVVHQQQAAIEAEQAAQQAAMAQQRAKPPAPLPAVALEPPAKKTEPKTDAPAAEPKPESRPAPAAAPPASAPDSRIPPGAAARHPPVDGATQVVVSAGPYPSRPEAEAELSGKIERAVAEHVDAYLAGRDGHVHLPLDYIREHIVKEQWEQPSELTLGSGPVPMTTVFALLQFDHSVNARIDEAVQEAVVQRRMMVAGFVLAELLALLTVVWLYLKIDLKTAGAYRWRLRLAAGLAILLIVAAGAAITA